MSQYTIAPKTAGHMVNVRAKASLDSEIVRQVADGDVIEATRVPKKNWVKLEDGYVMAELCKLIPKNAKGKK